MSDEVLFRTIVGSHLWGMNHAGSDTDVFEVFAAPTADILRGTANTRSTFVVDEQTKTDVARHEIQTVIEQLLKGNVNFVWGVYSPVVMATSDSLGSLRAVYSPAKNCYGSIHGLATKNYHKYFGDATPNGEDGQPLPPHVIAKKRRIVYRTLRFGIDILEGNGIRFKGVPNVSDDDLTDAILDLEMALEKSALPEKPDEEPLRDLLYRLRLGLLER